MTTWAETFDAIQRSSDSIVPQLSDLPDDFFESLNSHPWPNAMFLPIAPSADTAPAVSHTTSVVGFPLTAGASLRVVR